MYYQQKLYKKLIEENDNYFLHQITKKREEKYSLEELFDSFENESKLLKKIKINMMTHSEKKEDMKTFNSINEWINIYKYDIHIV